MKDKSLPAPAAGIKVLKAEDNAEFKMLTAAKTGMVVAGEKLLIRFETANTSFDKLYFGSKDDAFKSPYVQGTARSDGLRGKTPREALDRQRDSGANRPEAHVPRRDGKENKHDKKADRDRPPQPKRRAEADRDALAATEIKVRTEYVPENAEKVDHRHRDPHGRGKSKLRSKTVVPEHYKRQHETRKQHPKKAFAQIAQQGESGGELSHAASHIGRADVAGPRRANVDVPQAASDDEPEGNSTDGVRAESKDDGPGDKSRCVDLSH